MQLRITEEGSEPVLVDVDVAGGGVTLGRSRENDVVLAQRFVSGKHCRIDDGVLVTDLGSRNGTFLNKEAIAGPTLIGAKRLTVGGLTLRVEVVHDQTTPRGEIAAQIEDMQRRLSRYEGTSNLGSVPVSEVRQDAVFQLLDRSYARITRRCHPRQWAMSSRRICSTRSSSFATLRRSSLVSRPS